MCNTMELWIAMSGAVRLLLIDLRDLAVRQGGMTALQSALGELRREHATKESLLRRLSKAKLQ